MQLNSQSIQDQRQCRLPWQGDLSLSPSLARTGDLRRGGAALSCVTESRLGGSGMRRRASVLVLVVTMLGVLFVVGVAFLASMNFEAQALTTQARRDGETKAVNSIVGDLGSALRGAFMSAPTVPFADPITAGAPSPYAELPFVHNSFSPIEPSRVLMPRPGGVYGDGSEDEHVFFNWFTDLPALRSRPFVGPNYPPDTPIDVSLPVGLPLAIFSRCLDGPDRGVRCGQDSDCRDSVCTAPRLTDADGDGIADSLDFLASDLGLSNSQLDAISAEVNPAGRDDARVFAAVRVISHGGLVNLNYGHPNLLDRVFDLPALNMTITDGDRGRDTYFLYHRPSRDRRYYSSLLEEPILRRRVLLPSEEPGPSSLQGDPFVDIGRAPHLNADFVQFLMPPLVSGRGFEDIARDISSTPHRYQPFTPCDYDGDCIGNGFDLWQVRMEPLTARLAADSLDHYDRRHLVTTVSHDDLLSRGARVRLPEGKTADILEKMREANRAMHSPDDCPIMPFEYADYPHDIQNKTIPGSDAACTCPSSPNCSFDPRKGRLQLSLSWLQQAMTNPQPTPLLLTDPLQNQAHALVHDVFAMMLQNLIGTDWENRPVCTDNDGCESGEYCRLGAVDPSRGRCSSVAPYWDDIECVPGSSALCPSGEVCLPIPVAAGALPIGLCHDSWTGQRHSQALLSRTAASLTANFFDFADGDDSPTRIALRSFDFNRGRCYQGANDGLPCVSATDCLGGQCIAPPMSVGREIDGDPSLGSFKPIYVYGLERQPYITAVATEAEVPDAGGGQPGPSKYTGWAVEIYNPYSATLPAGGDYFLYELPVGTTSLQAAPFVQLFASIPPEGAGGPFTVFHTAGTVFESLTTSAIMNRSVINAPASMQFSQGSVIYLVYRYTYLGDAQPTDIILDQFEIAGTNIGVYGQLLSGTTRVGDPHVYVASRGVPDPVSGIGSRWLATVPVASESGPFHDATSASALLGAWRNQNDPEVHPVEVDFANTGVIANAGGLNASYPTTGSMLLLMRHANRGLLDSTPVRSTIGSVSTVPITGLSFTTKLNELTIFNVGTSIGPVNIPIPSAYQIDNGRLPIFDPGQYRTGTGSHAVSNAQLGSFAAHHVPPQLTKAYDPANWNPQDPATRPVSGNLNNLPWGQLVFDYFTALPLSSPGPYPPCAPQDTNCPPPEPTPADVEEFAAAVPRVDLGGLRVHGRININAAPWMVMAGLPYVPMNRIPAPFVDTIENTLGLRTAFSSIPREKAGSTGELLARGLAAYREGREIRGHSSFDPRLPNDITTGNYGFDDVDNNVISYRGWSSTMPHVRRGSGFMSVGELANVRHPNAWVDPAAGTPGTSPFRMDRGMLDHRPLNSDPSGKNDADGSNNGENFISAAAGLIALGDWVTVRSQVFTVYGVFRGEEDIEITDGDGIQQVKLRTKDVDSRAIRFQETIDRLPTFLGEPLPVRIGDRSVAKYLDTRND